MDRDLYQHPEYYDCAFAWRDVGAEVAVMRAAWQRFGHGRLRRMMELACGTAPHAPAVRAAGIDFIGIDLAPAMLAAARRRSPQAKLICADLHAPAVADGAVDMACTLLGSLYVSSLAALDHHLAHIADLVRPGGLWLLDWCLLFDDPDEHYDDWQADGPDGPATIRYQSASTGQPGMQRETLTVTSATGTTYQACTESLALRAELVLPLIACHPRWTLLGNWNHWDLDRPLGSEPADRPITLLART